MHYVHSSLWQHPSDSHNSQHGQGLPEDRGQSHSALSFHQNPRVFAYRPAPGLPWRPYQSCGYHHKGKGQRVWLFFLPISYLCHWEASRRIPLALENWRKNHSPDVGCRCPISLLCGGSWLVQMWGWGSRGGPQMPLILKTYSLSGSFQLVSLIHVVEVWVTPHLSGTFSPIEILEGRWGFLWTECCLYSFPSICWY